MHLHLQTLLFFVICMYFQVNEEAGLSPGKHTVEYANKRDGERLRKQQKADLPSTKRRRLVLKQERSTNQAASEVLEGTSYE